MISYKLGSVAFTVRIVIFSSSPMLGKCSDIILWWNLHFY